MRDQVAPRAAEWRAHWQVVASAFIGNGVGFNLFVISAGLFVLPIQQEFGISRTAAMVSPMAFLAVSLLGPVAGIQIDRRGPRALAIAGFAGLSLAYVLFAVIPAKLAAYYAIVALIVIFGTVAGPAVFSKGVSACFTRSAGLAFGVVQSGVSLVSALFVPFLNGYILRDGWRTGYLLCACVVGLIGIPVLWIAFRPGQGGTSTRAVGTVSTGHRASAAFTEPQFWLLTLAFSCGTFCIGGFMSHLYPLLVAGKMIPAMATTVLTVYLVSIGVARPLVGLMLDRWSPVAVAATCMVLTAFGVVLLYLGVGGVPAQRLVYLAVFLIGWGQGAEGDFIAFFTLRKFGREAFAAIYTSMSVMVGIALAAGGMLFAYCYDRLHTYQPAMLGAAVLWTTAAVLIVVSGGRFWSASPDRRSIFSSTP